MILDRDALGRNSLGHASGIPLAAGRGSFAETGAAAAFEAVLAAPCGLYAFTGEGAFLSSDLLAGGTIVAGTFSRGKWRAIQDAIAAEKAAEERRVAAARRKRQQERDAGAVVARAAALDRRAQEDQANAGAAALRSAQAAAAISSHRQQLGVLMHQAAILHAAADRAHANELAAQQDEAEALALLLAA